MNITKVRTKDGRWGRPVTVTLSQLADYMRGSAPRPLVELLGRRISRAKVYGADARPGVTTTAARLPYLIFSATFSGKGIYDFRRPTGLMLLSLDTGNDPLAAQQLRHIVNQLPQTVMSFTGSSRHTLKIIVRCLQPNGKLPAEADKYEAFLCTAQEQAARFYAAYTGHAIHLAKQTLTRGCRMSQDEQLYYNPAAQPLTVVAAATLNTRHALARTDEDGHTLSKTDEAVAAQQRAEFYACLTKALESDIPDGSAAGAERTVVELAALCHRAGLDEEASVRRTANYRQWGIDELTVRKIFHTVYARPLAGRPVSQMPLKEQIARKVQEFFERRYELRHNVMKDCEEFRPRCSDEQRWQLLTPRDIRRIAHEEMLDAGAAWPVDIENYARSSLAKSYNPVHEFLAGCGQWDRHTDHIGSLARRVHNSNPHWQQLFHRWFLGMVATWLGHSSDFSNAVVPMLIGPQGCHKSTFCRLILPRSLREYYIDDIKLNNAEQVERMLCRMALVNIDEYNAKSAREQAKIKRILTEHDVQVRRMREANYTLMQRMASFIATTNERQPLTDSTGSRRYLCVEVAGTIDTETPVNYQQLYAQALYEIENGEGYYPTKEEEQLMERYNKQFVSATATELLLEAYYRPAERRKDNFIKAADILSDLLKVSHGNERPNMKQLVNALKAARYEYGAIHGVRGWYAKRVRTK